MCASQVYAFTNRSKTGCKKKGCKTRSQRHDILPCHLQARSVCLQRSQTRRAPPFSSRHSVGAEFAVKAILSLVRWWSSANLARDPVFTSTHARPRKTVSRGPRQAFLRHTPFTPVQTKLPAARRFQRATRTPAKPESRPRLGRKGPALDYFGGCGFSPLIARSAKLLCETYCE